MFTGIITDIGIIKSIDKIDDNLTQAVISTLYNTNYMEIGCSVACSGVCLTVTDKGDSWFSVDISGETLSCTTLDNWQVDTKINLERSLKAGDELGGHIVSGHVDAIGEVVNIEDVQGNKLLSIKAPDELLKFIAAKGSITIDGVSLTVNKVDGNIFQMNIIPHTLEKTTFSNLKQDDKVNIEIDMLARYTARILEYGK